MLPLFPSNLDPTILGSIVNGSNTSNTNEENEISELEQEHTKFFQELEKIASDITPLGKLHSVQNNESDSNSEEGSNDEESDTEEESSNDAEVTVNY